FEWAHLALSIWPQRVRERSEQDLSIAIAHGFATGDELSDAEEPEEPGDGEPFGNEDEDEEGDETA
ncbi:MAG: hypothetical protein EA424_00810, partial [Planctomycetaceae bacterium]